MGWKKLLGDAKNKVDEIAENRRQVNAENKRLQEEEDHRKQEYLDKVNNLLDKFEISKFEEFMKLNKIEIGTNYPYALTQQPLFKKNNKEFEIANFIAKNVACLPINPYMRESEIRYVVNKLETFILNK